MSLRVIFVSCLYFVVAVCLSTSTTFAVEPPPPEGVVIENDFSLPAIPPAQGGEKPVCVDVDGLLVEGVEGCGGVVGPPGSSVICHPGFPPVGSISLFLVSDNSECMMLMIECFEGKLMSLDLLQAPPDMCLVGAH